MGLYRYETADRLGTLGPLRTFLAPIVVLAVCLVGTWGAWRLAKDARNKERTTYFEYRARDAQNRIEQRLRTYEQVLRDTHAYVISAPVTRKGFAQFVAGMRLSKNFPGIQGVGFSLVIPKAELARHTEAMRKEGFPDYAVRPPGDRDPYTSIIYLEPFQDRNLRAFGYDMHSEPVRQAAMDLAVDQDDVALSGKVTLVQETDKDRQVGFLMYMPVFSLNQQGQGISTLTPAERRAQVKAWVYAPFRMNDLMRGVFGEGGNDLDIEVHDGPEPSAETLMFDNDPSKQFGTNITRIQTQLKMEFGHHVWTLRIQALPALEKRMGAAKDSTVLGAGVVASVLLTLLTGTLATERVKAESLATERGSRYQALMEQANDAILLMSPDGVIKEVNNQAVARFGYELDELQGLNVITLHPPEYRDQAQERLQGIRRHGSGRFEANHRRKDGSRIISEVSVKVIHIGGEPLNFAIVHDLTDRKAAEQAVLDSEIFKSATLDAVSAQLCVLSTDGTILAVNRAWKEFPCPRGTEVPVGNTGIGVNYLSVCDNATGANAVEAPLMAAGLRQVMAGQREFFTLEYPCHEGPEERWFLARVTRFQDATSRVVVSHEDITERWLAMRTLAESEARFRTMADAAPVLIWIAGTDKLCTWFNHGWLEFTGRTLEQETGNGWTEGVHPEDFNRCLDIYVEAFDARRPFRMEYRLRRADGVFRWILDHGVPRFDGQGQFVGFIGSCVDINDMRSAKEALAREGARYRSIMDIARDGIHILDDQGRLVECNAAFMDSLGRAGEDPTTLRVHDWDTQIPQEQLVEVLQDLIARPAAFETRHRRKDGSVIDVEVNAGGIVLDGKPFLLAASRDISERKQAEREIALRQAQLEELNQFLEERVREAVDELRYKDRMLTQQSRQAAMGEMIGNIAHQWRQPLSSLSILLANLRDSIRMNELDPADLATTFAKGDALIQKMSSTINDFRDFFKPDKAKVTFSALHQIHTTQDLVAASFEAAHIQLQVQADRDVQLFGFPNEFSQVLMNLLVNAKQAIMDSGRKDGRILLGLDQTADNGRIRVLDNGGGIPQNAIDRIFEPFFTTRESGSGIGLYMSKQIIEGNMEGRLSVRNVDGGAEFEVILPSHRESP